MLRGFLTLTKNKWKSNKNKKNPNIKKKLKKCNMQKKKDELN